jgi:hypothetical protein
MDPIQLIDWHSKKFTNYCPTHFTKVATNKLTHDMLEWAMINCEARFSLSPIEVATGCLSVIRGHHIAFESPDDAIAFSLFFMNQAG